MTMATAGNPPSSLLVVGSALVAGVAAGSEVLVVETGASVVATVAFAGTTIDGAG